MSPANAPMEALIAATLARIERDQLASVRRLQLALLAYRLRQITYHELREVLR